MKKFLQIIGVLTLFIGSFIYSDKVAYTSSETDQLLQKIKSYQGSYYKAPIEAIVNNNNIIAGKNGKKVNIHKSYKNMSEVGYFNEKLLIYDIIPIKNKLKNNNNKFIIGSNTNDIALIFEVTNNDNIDKIINILNATETKASFFIDSTYLEQNYNKIKYLLSSGHTIGSLDKYNTPSFDWASSVIRSFSVQKNNYCYVKSKDAKALKKCYLNNLYTILPKKVIDKNPFINFKNNLSEGTIISFKINNQLESQLINIINYANHKGHKIVSIETLLSE